jgi:hypothetical protein
MLITVVTENDVYGRRLFALKFKGLNYGLSYELENEERSTPSSEGEATTQTTTEQFTVSMNGWIYHPALAVFTLSLRPEWEQVTVKNGTKTKSRNFYEGYDSSLTIFQYKPYTLTLLGRRERETINSNFAQQSKVTFDTYGGILNFSYPVLPTTFQYYHKETDQTGFFEFDEDGDEMRMTMRYNRHLGKSTLDVRYDEETTRLRTTTNRTRSKQIIFNNDYDIASGKKLTSSWSYAEDDSGGRTFKRSAIRENLLWRLRQNLRTRSAMSYSKNEVVQSSSSESINLVFNATHQLYENLTTTFNTNWRKSRFSSGDDKQFGGALNFVYTRKIPVGELSLSMGQVYDILDSDRQDSAVEVFGEGISLRFGEITLLANNNVNLDSIEVWNLSRTVLFIENIDYRVTEIDSDVRITCVAGGAIDRALNCSVGAPVIVDYSFFDDTNAKISTWTQRYGIRLSVMKFWNMSYSYGKNEEMLLSGDTTRQLSNSETHTVGTDVTWRWSKTTAWYADKDSTNIPTREWRIAENIRFSPLRRVSINVNGNYGERKFTDTGERETGSGASAGIQIQTSHRSRLTVDGFVNKIEGSGEETQFTGGGALFEMIYRRLLGTVRYVYSEEKDDLTPQTITNHNIIIQVRTKGL